MRVPVHVSTPPCKAVRVWLCAKLEEDSWPRRGPGPGGEGPENPVSFTCSLHIVSVQIPLQRAQ